jgi:hypothetical protein
LHPPPADLVHVLLGTSGLRVPDVAPVQHQDPRPADPLQRRARDAAGVQGRARPESRLCIRSTAPKLARPSRTRWNVESSRSVQATGSSTICSPSP